MRALLLIALLVGCQKPRAHQCPGNTAGHCLMGERCTYDKARDCQVCICEPLDGDGKNPQRHDDPTDPPPLSQ